MNYLSTFLASILIWCMFVAIFLVWKFRKNLAAYQVIHVICVACAALLVSQLIKELIPTERPYILNGNPIYTITTPLDSAFPSTHTAVAFAMVFGLYKHNKKVGALFFPPAILVGVGRVMGNVHFPIDILGGILVALLVSIILGHQKLLKFFQKAWITS